jgi:hypothetical protein
MRKLFFTFLSITALFCAPVLPASAALVGTSVTGSLQFNGGSANFFDPVYGFVPSGYLNSAGTTVTVSGSAAEFGYDDGGNRFTANFTDSQLLISDLIEASGSNLPFTMTFTDTGFAGQGIAVVSDSFPLNYSLNGNVLTIRGAGNAVTTGQTFAATFNITAAPEPSPWTLLLLSGIVALIFANVRMNARAKAGSQN